MDSLFSGTNFKLLIKYYYLIVFYSLLKNTDSIERIIARKPPKINEIDSFFLFFTYKEYPFNIVYTPPIITAIDNAIPESIILNNPKANIITLIIGNNFSMQLFI